MSPVYSLNDAEERLFTEIVNKHRAAGGVLQYGARGGGIEMVLCGGYCQGFTQGGQDVTPVSECLEEKRTAILSFPTVAFAG
ncbi:MAG: hypothetical protein ACI4P8_05610 [Akkermansia sp.]